MYGILPDMSKTKTIQTSLDTLSEIDSLNLSDLLFVGYQILSSLHLRLNEPTDIPSKAPNVNKPYMDGMGYIGYLMCLVPLTSLQRLKQARREVFGATSSQNLAANNKKQNITHLYIEVSWKHIAKHYTQLAKSREKMTKQDTIRDHPYGFARKISCCKIHVHRCATHV